MPHPLVKWSYEPRARRGRAARARPRHPPGDAAAEGARRSSRSRWTTGTPRSTTPTSPRRSSGRPTAAPPPAPRRSPRSPAGSRRRPTRSWSPGPTSTRAAPGTPRSPSPSARTCRCSRARRPAAGGSASPRATRTSAASCRRRSAPSPRRSRGRDLILVVGSSVFPYYPNIPGPLLPEGAELVEITSDPDEAARAPMGDAIVADVKLTLEALLAEVGESDRDAGESLPEPTDGPRASDPITRDLGDARPARRLPRRRDHRPGGAVVDQRAAQPAAPLEARQLLLRRRRRPRASGSRRRSGSSSPSRSGRSCA